MYIQEEKYTRCIQIGCTDDISVVVDYYPDMDTVDVNSEDAEINIIRRWKLSSLQHVWFMKPTYWRYTPPDKFLYLNSVQLREVPGGILRQHIGSQVTQMFAPVRKWHYKEELIWLLKKAKHSKLVEAITHLENANFVEAYKFIQEALSLPLALAGEATEGDGGSSISSEQRDIASTLVENTPQINDVVIFNFKEHPNEWRISTVNNITNVTQAEAKVRARSRAEAEASAKAKEEAYWVEKAKVEAAKAKAEAAEAQQPQEEAQAMERGQSNPSSQIPTAEFQDFD